MIKKDKEGLASLLKNMMEIQKWPNTALLDLLEDVLGPEEIIPVLTKLQLAMWERNLD